MCGPNVCDALILSAKLEEKREEEAGKEEQKSQKTDWREVAALDLDDSGGGRLPRQHAWSDLPQEPVLEARGGMDVVIPGASPDRAGAKVPGGKNCRRTQRTPCTAGQR